MDPRLAALQAFLSADGIDDEEYYKESQEHIQSVRGIIRKDAQWIRESAGDILKVHDYTSPSLNRVPVVQRIVQTADPIASAQHVHPAIHSLSYLLILEYLLEAPGWNTQQAHESLASYMVEFLLQFDARQIRCKGSTWSDVLKAVYNDRGLFPVGLPYLSPVCEVTVADFHYRLPLPLRWSLLRS